MGSEELRDRAIWQHYSGANAGIAERDFYHAFEKLFEDSAYKIRSKPGEFSNIYTEVTLSPEVLAEIYTPPEPITRHGIRPDYAIDNTETGKTLYVEVKRQDGWVENGRRSDGRGNAHERSCKFFTPGLLRILRRGGITQNDALPFWTVFLGDISRDPCRVREVACWYEGFDAHFFFWRDARNPEPLLKHFTYRLSHLID